MAEVSNELQSQLDSAYEMIAADEIDQAWVLLGRLEQEFPDSAEVMALMGDTALRVGDIDYAVELYDRAVELDPEWSDAYSARANCLIEQNEIDEASADIERALELDPDNPEAHYVRAILLELEGRFRLADNAFRQANRLDPDSCPMPIRVSRKVFDESVKKAMALLPDEFRKRLDGVQIFVSDLPQPKLTEEGNLSPLIMGAFDGYSITERLPSDAWSQVPPTIHLYQKNIERQCRDKGELVTEIEITLLHEVGHFFGLEDEDLDRLELA
jgi:predicted Zn-dependent protease with MMP-like domain